MNGTACTSLTATAAELERQVSEFLKDATLFGRLFDDPLTLYGVPIIESPLLDPQPKLQLSKSVDFLGAKFCAEMNQWLLDMFGTEEPRAHIGAGRVFLGSQMLRELRLNSNSIIGINCHA